VNYFGALVKIMDNHKTGVKRSLWRNQIFDVLRNCLAPILFPLILGLPITKEDVWTQLVFIVHVSLLSQLINKNLNRKFYERHSFVWAIIQLEFWTLFGQSLLQALFNSEIYLSGNILWTALIVLLEIHFTLGVNIIEDFVYRDLGVLTNNFFTDNFYLYLAYLICIPLILATQVFVKGVNYRQSWV